VERENSFWLDTIGDPISAAFKSRPSADRIVAIAHNAKPFDLLFLLKRLVQIKLMRELLDMNGQKIMCLRWRTSFGWIA